MSADLPATLTRLEAWLAEHAPGIHATLRPGIADVELDALETATGLTLPEAFRTLYRWHDGQDQRGYFYRGGVFGLNFLPLERVQAEWEGWRDTDREIAHEFPELHEDMASLSVSHPAGAIREVYTTPGWLGFLSDGGSNSVGLDFNPGPAGTPGQVITFGRDEHDKYVLADSLDAFLREYLHRLESGRVTVKALAGYGHEMWSIQLHGADGQSYENWGKLADLYPGFGAAPARRSR